MSIGAFAAISGLVLNPFGSVPDFLQAGKPWYGFDSQGPVLQLVRVQKASAKDCKAWSDALTAVPADELSPVRMQDVAGSLQAAWQPWGEKDLDAIRDCDDFPCKVKLDEPEVEQMKKVKPEGRLAELLSLIGIRIHRYEKTQVRKGYELPGDPIDPWKYFEARGFKTSVSRPDTPVLFARKLNFDPNRMLTIHQVMDRRVNHTPFVAPRKKAPAIAPVTAPVEAVVWMRDVYTDHYFDSWGEWSSIHCTPGTSGAPGEVVVIQSILSEMDLLKSRNIFARAVFGKYRSAFEDNGKGVLNRQFEQLKKAANELETAPH